MDTSIENMHTDWHNGQKQVFSIIREVNVALFTCCFCTLASLFAVFFVPSPLLLFCITEAWCSVRVFNTLSVSLMVSSSL